MGDEMNLNQAVKILKLHNFNGSTEQFLGKISQVKRKLLSLYHTDKNLNLDSKAKEKLDESRNEVTHALSYILAHQELKFDTPETNRRAKFLFTADGQFSTQVDGQVSVIDDLIPTVIKFRVQNWDTTKITYLSDNYTINVANYTNNELTWLLYMLLSKKIHLPYGLITDEFRVTDPNRELLIAAINCFSLRDNNKRDKQLTVHSSILKYMLEVGIPLAVGLAMIAVASFPVLTPVALLSISAFIMIVGLTIFYCYNIELVKTEEDYVGQAARILTEQKASSSSEFVIEVNKQDLTDPNKLKPSARKSLLFFMRGVKKLSSTLDIKVDDTDAESLKISDGNSFVADAPRIAWHP